MTRTITDIYKEIKIKQQSFLELTTFENTSRMSVLNAINYTVASSIWVFENLLETFKVDFAKNINQRINGTRQYYINALLKYQSGDEIKMNEDGTNFGYDTVDASKRIITSAVCEELSEVGFHDNRLYFKIASGAGGNFTRIPDEELVNIRNYMRSISFAGTNVTISSRKGDVLVPKVIVSYDGRITIQELKENIDGVIRQHLESTAFTGRFYPTKLINAIGSAEHVVDVISEGYSATDKLGIYVVQYNDNDEVVDSGEPYGMRRVINGFDLSSGFLREKNSEDDIHLLSWDDSIWCITEGDLSNYTTEAVILTLGGRRIENLPTLVVNNQTITPTPVK